MSEEFGYTVPIIMTWMHGLVDLLILEDLGISLKIALKLYQKDNIREASLTQIPVQAGHLTISTIQ